MSSTKQGFEQVKLALKMNDWKGADAHAYYLERLKKQHKLKSRFWDL